MLDPRDLMIGRPGPHEVPWPLLLEAEPFRERIERDLSLEWTRVAKLGDQVFGVYVLVPRGATYFELMNIAVRADVRRCGIGQRLLGHAIGLAETKGGRVIDASAGEASGNALAFFQRAGFRVVADRPPCRDRVRLRLVLTPE